MAAQWMQAKNESIISLKVCSPSHPPFGMNLPVRTRTQRSPTAMQVGVVSWSVDTEGHAYPSQGRTGDQFPHVVVDRSGVEWTVREIATPQSWAKASHCLVLNSR